LCKWVVGDRVRLDSAQEDSPVDTSLRQQARNVIALISHAQNFFGAPAPPAFVQRGDLEDDLGRGRFDGQL
jgi:hypothetical protein